MEDKKIIKWTPEQQEAIYSRNQNLLISASAGSGKTTVMIERIISLMLEKQIPITKFLVVTFTKASASDMKQKLIDKLLKKGDMFSLSQIENVEVSDISNLHSFCSRLITTYFYEVGIDPTYHIIDDIESSYLKDKALTKLFEKKEENSDKNYYSLFEIFQQKRKDKFLRNVIVRFSNILNSHLNGEKWFNKTINGSYNLDLSKNECAKIINSYVCNEILDDARICEDFANKCLNYGAEKLYSHFIEINSALKSVNKKNSYLVNAKNIFEIELERTPTVSKDLKFLSEEASAIKKQIKQNILNYQENFVSKEEETLITGLKKSRDHLQNLYDLVCEFDSIYAELKKQINGLDFNDLERYALKILSNPTILQAVKDKYDYVFVDEYQDINNVQEEIISLVSKETNRFMVGDVKQSIYRFRLCDPDIFLQKYNEYNDDNKTSKLIKLNCNFRSDKNILSFVDDIFSGVMTESFGGVDYKKDSVFVAGENNLNNSKAVNVCYIDSSVQKEEKKVLSGIYSVKNHEQAESEEAQKAIAEANLVASKIAELVNPINDNHLSFGDIAILVGTRNEHTHRFVQILENLGIPVSSDEKHNLLDKNYIQELVNFAKLCVNQKDDFVMFKVLKSRLFNFSDADLIKIRKLDSKLKFNECVYKYKEIDDCFLKDKLERFLKTLNNYQKIARLMDIKFFIKNVIEYFELENINFLNKDGERFNDEVDAFILSLPNVSVVDFVLEYSNLPLEYEGDCGGDAVKVMTIHKSKGLEFRAVFLVNTSNQFTLKSTMGSILFNKQFGVGLNYFDFDKKLESSTIAMSAIKMIERRKIIEEQQRVLYVGLTRAIEKMFVICTKSKDKVKEIFAKRPTSFCNWFEPIIAKNLQNISQNNIVFEEYNLHDLNIKNSEKNTQIILKKEEIKEQNWFEYKHNLSVNIPLKNSVSKILKIKNLEEDYVGSFDDNKQKSSAHRGTVYHKVLQKINLKDLESLDKQLCKILDELSEEERNVIDVNIIKNVFLEPFFNEILQSDIVLQEREFYAKLPAKLIDDNIKDDNFIMQGVVDLVVIKPNEIIILDYKTGGFSEEKLEKYAFQINVYADVIERSFNKKVTHKYLYFLDLKKLFKI